MLYLVIHQHPLIDKSIQSNKSITPVLKPWFSQVKSKYDISFAKAAEIAIATNVIPLGNDADLGDIIQDDEHDAAE